MKREGLRSARLRSVFRHGTAAAFALLFPLAAGADDKAPAPVSTTPVAALTADPMLGGAPASAGASVPAPASAKGAASGSKPASSGYATSPFMDMKSPMGVKMFEGAGNLSSFNDQRSPFDNKFSPLDLKASDLSDKRVEIGGRSVYAPMLSAFDKRIEAPQAGGFQGVSPLAASLSGATAASGQASPFDARRAAGFDKTVAVAPYQGREAQAIRDPKPFAQGMSGGADPMTAQFIRDGGRFDATISLEEVRDLINKDVKGASLSIPQPGTPTAKP